MENITNVTEIAKTTEKAMKTVTTGQLVGLGADALLEVLRLASDRSSESRPW